MFWNGSRVRARAPIAALLSACLLSSCLIGATLAMSGMGAAQVAASSPLEAQLKSIFKLSKVEWGQADVVHRGTVLKVNSESFLYGTPPNQVIICAATVQKGSEQPPSSFCRSMTKSSGGMFLSAGQKLYVTNIKVSLPKETVTLDLAAFGLDPSTQAPLMPTLKTSVNFVFAGGYLNQAHAGLIADAIGNHLPTEGGAATGAQAAAAQPAPAPEPPAQPTAAAPTNAAPAPMTAAPAPMTAAPSAAIAAPAPVPAAPVAMSAAPPPAASVTAPAQVELGMTEEEVKSILGPPTRANQPAGNTKVYVYHKQITFRDGRVSSIE